MHQKLTRAALGGLAGIAILATAAPAIARDADPKTERAAPAKTAKSAKVTGEQRYCVDEATTGSRIKRRTCLTASEWSAHGVDIVSEARKGARR